MFDKDNSHTITRDEVSAILLADRSEKTEMKHEAEIVDHFLHDLQGDGCITREEFLSMMKHGQDEFGRQMSRPPEYDYGDYEQKRGGNTKVSFVSQPESFPSQPQY